MTDILLTRKLGPDGGSAPRAAVVIVAWRWNTDLLDALQVLSNQTTDEFELIVVDNGGSFLPELEAVTGLPPTTYVGLAENVGASAGRNAALAHARAELLIFLDDDATAHPGLVTAYVEAFADPHLIGARGRIVHKTDRYLNRADIVSDHGDRPIPALLDTENNCAIRREAFAELGGFNEALFGHEGVELSLRVIDRFGEGRLRYLPEAVVAHEFSDSVWHYLRKSFRHGRMAAKVDMARVERIQPAHAAPLADLGALPLRLAGRLLSDAGRVWSRLFGAPGTQSRLRTY